MWLEFQQSNKWIFELFLCVKNLIIQLTHIFKKGYSLNPFYRIIYIYWWHLIVFIPASIVDKTCETKPICTNICKYSIIFNIY